MTRSQWPMLHCRIVATKLRVVRHKTACCVCVFDSAFITIEQSFHLEEGMDDACTSPSESPVSPGPQLSSMDDLSTDETSEASVSDIDMGTALNDEVCISKSYL